MITIATRSIKSAKRRSRRYERKARHDTLSLSLFFFDLLRLLVSKVFVVFWNEDFELENSSKKETLESVFFSLFYRRYTSACYVINTFTTTTTRTYMIEDTNFASGVFYAVLASIFFGSFAVPIKTKAIVKANVDPVAVSLIVHLSSLFWQTLSLF